MVIRALFSLLAIALVLVASCKTVPLAEEGSAPKGTMDLDKGWVDKELIPPVKAAKKSGSDLDLNVQELRNFIIDKIETRIETGNFGADETIDEIRASMSPIMKNISKLSISLGSAFGTIKKKWEARDVRITDDNIERAEVDSQDFYENVYKVAEGLIKEGTPNPEDPESAIPDGPVLRLGTLVGVYQANLERLVKAHDDAAHNEPDAEKHKRAMRMFALCIKTADDLHQIANEILIPLDAMVFFIDNLYFHKPDTTPDGTKIPVRGTFVWGGYSTNDITAADNIETKCSSTIVAIRKLHGEEKVLNIRCENTRNLVQSGAGFNFGSDLSYELLVKIEQGGLIQRTVKTYTASPITVSERSSYDYADPTAALGSWNNDCDDVFDAMKERFEAQFIHASCGIPTVTCRKPGSYSAYECTVKSTPSAWYFGTSR